MALPLYSLDELFINHDVPDTTKVYLRLLDEQLATDKAFTHYYSYASGFVKVTVMADCYDSDGTIESFDFSCDVSDTMISLMPAHEYERGADLRHRILSAGLRDKAWEHRTVYGF